ncbi:MAG: NADPH:quinone oxidoreductase family protein [Streptomycetaceae bacterium]|jgi:NADPH2:quinone reductase|nr:NADPH:quinone oxidoreductase family protein [Streptomycetaceae bacterium]
MKAIQITEFGGPEVMKLVDLEDPSIGEGQELINVTAIGINYADTHQTENSYLSQQKLPLIPGIEVVGKTAAGVRVLAPIDGGGYSQKAVAYSAALIPIPDTVTDQQALAMLVQGTTAWHILKTIGHLKVGETVVVHAAAGGVGSIAIQLAKMWGAKVIAVASSEAKRSLALSLGADAVVDATEENLGDALKAANAGKRVNIVLEMVGGKTFDESLEILAPFGRLVTYGMASRTAPSLIQPASLMGGSKTISGFWLSHCFGKKELMNDVIAQLFKLIEEGKLKPVIGEVFPLSQATLAHKSMLARETMGKITLNPME